MRKILVVVLVLIIGLTLFLLKDSVLLSDPESNKTQSIGDDLNAVVIDRSNVEIRDEHDESLSDVSREELFDRIKKLPTNTDVINLSAQEVHHTPLPVIEGAQVLGEIQEDAELNPEKRKMTVEFFKACAEDEEIIISLRAVCWKNVLELIPKWQVIVPISDAKVPQEVVSLALKLM